MVHVRSADDPARLLSGLQAAAADIAALDAGWRSSPGLSPGDRTGPAFVSGPIGLPDGFLLMVDLGSTPAALVARVLNLLVQRLSEAGVRDAWIGAGRRLGDRYAAILGFGPAARAWLRGPLGRPFGHSDGRPPHWLRAIAIRWLAEHHPPGTGPIGVVVSVERPSSWPALDADLAWTLETGWPVAALASDFATAAAGLAVDGGPRDTQPAASLTAAGAAWTAGEVARELASQRDLIRAHADALVWAGASVALDARGLLTVAWSDEQPGQAPASGRRPDVRRLADLLVPDGMWYQLLGEGHLARLGGPPAGGRRLGADRVELTVGEPQQWMPGHPDRPAVQARARELLAGCLPDVATVAVLDRERLLAARSRDTEGFFGVPS